MNERVDDEDRDMDSFSRTSFVLEVCLDMVTHILETEEDEDITVEVKRDTTFAEVRKILAQETGHTVDQIEVFFPRLNKRDAVEVIDGDVTLHELRVRNEERVEVNVPKLKKRRQNKRKRKAKGKGLKISEPTFVTHTENWQAPASGPPQPILAGEGKAYYSNAEGISQWKKPGHRLEKLVPTRRERSKRTPASAPKETEIVVSSKGDLDSAEKERKMPTRDDLFDKGGVEEVELELDVELPPASKEDEMAKRVERHREHRRRVLTYIKDILRNFCMFDPKGKVIMFAASTIFLCFTFSANYALILYSGAPYSDVFELDWNARRSMLWFECTAANFVDFNTFGLIDFLGLAAGTVAGILELVDFLATI